MGAKRRLSFLSPYKKDVSYGSSSVKIQEGPPTQPPAKKGRRKGPRSWSCWTGEGSGLPAYKPKSAPEGRRHGVLGSRRIHMAWLKVIGKRPAQLRLTNEGKEEKEKRKEKKERKKKFAAYVGTLGLAKIVSQWFPQVTKQCGGEPMEIG